MKDHAAPLRKQFIADYARLEAKRAGLRRQANSQRKTRLGAETLERIYGLTNFDPAGKYTKESK
jgi:hypothetical protein